jgi:hypothetical protein
MVRGRSRTELAGRHVASFGSRNTSGLRVRATAPRHERGHRGSGLAPRLRKGLKKPNGFRVLLRVRDSEGRTILTVVPKAVGGRKRVAPVFLGTSVPPRDQTNQQPLDKDPLRAVQERFMDLGVSSGPNGRKLGRTKPLGARYPCVNRPRLPSRRTSALTSRATSASPRATSTMRPRSTTTYRYHPTSPRTGSR